MTRAGERRALLEVNVPEGLRDYTLLERKNGRLRASIRSLHRHPRQYI